MRKQSPRGVILKRFFKNLLKFTEKQLNRNPFFNKTAGWRLSEKEAPAQMFSREFQEHIFRERLAETACTKVCKCIFPNTYARVP